MARAFISVEALARRFPAPGEKGTTTVFEDVWFEVAEGDFVCMIGHSGCGKSTILNILAGLDTPSDGVVIVNGQSIDGPSLDRAVIFQGHALMPWLTALGNIELGVASRWRDWDRAKVRAHAERYLDLVHLRDAGRKRPSELSGGMKQRVGIARALAIEPKVLLMDEPFSALDALTRGALQDEVVSIRQKARQTTFMITHDVDEALLLADRILLMTNGPRARVAEIVENTLPKGRTRETLHKLPAYYGLRNHLIEFLVSRSRELAGTKPPPGADRQPPVVRLAVPGAIEGGPSHAASAAQEQPAGARPRAPFVPKSRSAGGRVERPRPRLEGSNVNGERAPLASRARPAGRSDTDKPKWR